MSWDTGLIIGFILGAAAMFIGCWFWAHSAMGDEFRPVEEPRAPKAPAIDAPALAAQHAAIHARYGESLILEAICEAPALDTIYVAYLTADSAHRRQSPINERMFYDACLGGAMRRVVDAYRDTRNAHPSTTTHPRSTTCH